MTIHANTASQPAVTPPSRYDFGAEPPSSDRSGEDEAASSGQDVRDDVKDQAQQARDAMRDSQ